MRYKTIFRLLGILLLIFSQSMLSPLIINFIFKEQVWQPFVISYGITVVVGFSLWRGFRDFQNELKIRDGFFLVVLFWLSICFFASIPMLLSVDNLINPVDAIFETVSGITTTGASVIDDLDSLPHAILYYRQQLQFIGGIGIVILAVAILPMLGVGGMQLFQTEIPGPMKDAKLTPRITQSAKAIWSIYLLLTMLCAVFYFLFGMSWFDALGESFGTVSTGGFTMHSNSFAYYKSEYIRIIASIFMLLGGTSFALHFVAIKKLSLVGYRNDSEFRLYLRLIILASMFIVYSLYKYHAADLNLHNILSSVFSVISLVTTTGFELEPLSDCRSFIPVLAVILMAIGGCAASTSGGLKILRVILVYKLIKRESSRIIHPQAVNLIKIGKNSLPLDTLLSVCSYVALFIALYILSILCFTWIGHDLESSIAIVSSTLTNSGYGIDNLKADFAGFDNLSKCMLIFLMLLGRLEIFPILILFTRQFWGR